MCVMPVVGYVFNICMSSPLVCDLLVHKHVMCCCQCCARTSLTVDLVYCLDCIILCLDSGFCSLLKTSVSLTLIIVFGDSPCCKRTQCLVSYDVYNNEEEEDKGYFDDVILCFRLLIL